MHSEESKCQTAAHVFTVALQQSTRGSSAEQVHVQAVTLYAAWNKYPVPAYGCRCTHIAMLSLADDAG